MFDLLLSWLVLVLPVALGLVLILVPAKHEDPQGHIRWRYVLGVCLILYGGLVGWQQFRAKHSDEAKQKATEDWQKSVTTELNQIANSPDASKEQKQAAEKLKSAVVKGPSLKQRALLLANELDEFDQSRRNESWNVGILGHEQEQGIVDKSMAFDNQTITKFRAQYGQRITLIVAEFKKKGLNVMNVPDVDERLINWNWNGKNHGASQLAAEFAQYLRKLAEQIDDKGNLIH